jgi:hypothetical protein
MTTALGHGPATGGRPDRKRIDPLRARLPVYLQRHGPKLAERIEHAFKTVRMNNLSGIRACGVGYIPCLPGSGESQKLQTA